MNRRERRPGDKRGAGRSTTTSEVLLGEALAHHRAERLAEAEKLYLQIVRQSPHHAQAADLLGVVALQSGRFSEAQRWVSKAVDLRPAEPSFHAHLGSVLRAQGKPGEAFRRFSIAVVLEPSHADYLFNLANALMDVGRADLALTHYLKVRSLKPFDPEILNNLGHAAERAGRLDAAERVYVTALTLKPDFPEVRNNLANLARLTDRRDFAKIHYRRALAGRPAYGAVHSNFGSLAHEGGALAAAADHCMTAITLDPAYTDAYCAVGAILGDQGRLEAADRAYRRASLCDPSGTEAVLQRLFLQLYRPSVGPANHLAFAKAAANRLYPAPAPRCREPGRARPRLGFLSGDFRAHVVGHLVLPTIEGLAKAGWPITLYCNSPADDPISKRFQSAATAWRRVCGLSDESLFEQIQADGVDILFDLSGLSALHRLAVLARKPAPIQVAWAGYPGTSGLAAMDYILADRHQVPEGADQFYSEKVVRLPDSYMLFAPPADAPEVIALPALAKGYVTFGSYNILKKISPPVVDAWSAILHRLPTARLMVKSRAADCPTTRKRVEQAFDQRGVDTSRLEFRGVETRADHLGAMAAVDIALDSFPYSGGMTTLESLWMGLPVIALAGTTFAGRHSLGYLSTAGLAELVAFDAAEYVEKAVALAENMPRLAGLRAGMRQRLKSSALMDETGFIGNVEAALLLIWQRYLDGLPPAEIAIEAPQRGNG